MSSQAERGSAQSEAGSAKEAQESAPAQAGAASATSAEAKAEAQAAGASAATSSTPSESMAASAAEPQAASDGSQPHTGRESAPAAEPKSAAVEGSGPAAEAKAESPAESATPVEAKAAAEATSSAETAPGAFTTEASQPGEGATELVAAGQRVDRARPSEHDVLDRAYAYSGMACMASGVVVGTLAFTSLAANLDALGNPKLAALALSVFGALLFGIGRVRRMLRGVERALASVARQTDRLDEVVREGDELRRDVGDVSGATTVLREEVASVQTHLENLTHIVSSPEIQVSMFHLAASQDKIAKRLDLALIERFKALHAEIAKMIEAVSRAQRELQGSVEGLESRAEQQFSAQTTRLERALEPVHSAAVEHAARLDRLDVRVKETAQELLLAHETVVEGLTRAGEASERNVRAAAAGLDKLRDQLEARLQGHSKALDGQLERVRADLEQRLARVEGEQTRCTRETAESMQAELEQRLARVEGEQARALREVAEALHGELDERAKSIREGIDALGGNLSRGQAGVANELQALAPRLEQRLGKVESEQVRALHELSKVLRSELEEHAGSLRESLAATADAMGRSQAGLASELQAVTPRFEQRLRDETGNLLAELQTLAHVGQAAVKEGLHELRANAQAAHRELTDGLARVAPEIESHLGEHSERMAGEAREAARTARQDLGELRRSLESALQQGVASLEELSKRSSQGLASEAGRLTAKLDELADAHAALARESSQAAGRMDVELTAFGQRLAQGLGRIDDAQSAVLSEITGRLTADRVRSERALQEGVRSIEASAQRAQQELSKGFADLAPALAAELHTQIEALQRELERSQAQSDRSSELRAEIQSLARRIEALHSADQPLLEGSLDGLAEGATDHAEPAHTDPAVPASSADRVETPLRIDPATEPPAALPRSLNARAAEARAAGEAAPFGAWNESSIRKERPAPFDAAHGAGDVDPEC